MLLEVIRHGATAWQAEHRYQGRRSDVALSAAGRAALAQADWVPACVYVTPLVRTAQTAAAVFPGAPQVAVPGLEEMDFGVFEGCTADEMAGDAAYRAWVQGGCEGACPGGESRTAFCGRVCAAFAGLLDELCVRRDAACSRAALVAHGGTLMAALERFADSARPYFDWHVACGCGYLLDAGPWLSERRVRVVRALDYTRAACTGPVAKGVR